MHLGIIPSTRGTSNLSSLVNELTLVWRSDHSNIHDSQGRANTGEKCISATIGNGNFKVLRVDASTLYHALTPPTDQ